MSTTTSATVIEIPMQEKMRFKADPDAPRGLETSHVLVTPSGHRSGIGAVPRGSTGRREMGGPIVPGPWAFTFGLCVVIDNHGGTAREMRELAELGQVHHVGEGTTLRIDGVAYRVRIERREYIYLDEIAEEEIVEDESLPQVCRELEEIGFESDSDPGGERMAIYGEDGSSILVTDANVEGSAELPEDSEALLVGIYDAECLEILCEKMTLSAVATIAKLFRESDPKA